jgi:hydroxymethylpyrimidine/phosphomethylpyrimidine kinase
LAITKEACVSREEVAGDCPAVLTIAGSDSGGGAGIQADLKTFSALSVFGASAITCVTAQNPREVTAIAALDPDVVRQQILAVCSAFDIRAAKTGMLYSAEIIQAVAAADVRQGIPILVVDPVMVSASGARLLKEDAIDALRTVLLPEARVVTPNLHEAEILCGHPISSVEGLVEAAREIGDHYDVACVAKGGHLSGDEVVDVLYDEGDEHIFKARRVHLHETHGAGCAFSAALTAFLARRELMKHAVARAKEYVRQAMENSVQVGHHHPLNFFAGSEWGSFHR